MTQNLLRDLDEVWPKVTQHWLYQWRELLNENLNVKNTIDEIIYYQNEPYL